MVGEECSHGMRGRYEVQVAAATWPAYRPWSHGPAFRGRPAAVYTANGVHSHRNRRLDTRPAPTDLPSLVCPPPAFLSVLSPLALAVMVPADTNDSIVLLSVLYPRTYTQYIPSSDLCHFLVAISPAMGSVGVWLPACFL